MTLSRVPNFASPPTTDTRTQSSSALITRIKQYTIGANTMPIEAKLRARCAASGGMFGIWENCALSAAFVKGSCTTLITMMATARARNGARNRGFSRTRSNTAVGSNNTRTRSRTAPITPSRTEGSPSRTAGTAPNIREKQVPSLRSGQALRACGAQDDTTLASETRQGTRSARERAVRESVHDGIVPLARSSSRTD